MLVQVYFTSLSTAWISSHQGLYPLILPANFHRSKLSNDWQLRNCPHYRMGLGFHLGYYFSMHSHLHNLDKLRIKLHTLLHKPTAILPWGCYIQPHPWCYDLCPSISSPYEVEIASKAKVCNCWHLSSWFYVSELFCTICRQWVCLFYW